MKSKKARMQKRPLQHLVGRGYRQQAEYLLDRPLSLIRQVLAEHTAAVLEEMHAQIKARTPGADMTPERFDEIARFLEKHYPRTAYPLWYAALEQAAALCAVTPNAEANRRLCRQGENHE